VLECNHVQLGLFENRMPKKNNWLALFSHWNWSFGVYTPFWDTPKSCFGSSGATKSQPSQALNTDLSTPIERRVAAIKN
jgi:hypothetical protein